MKPISTSSSVRAFTEFDKGLQRTPHGVQFHHLNNTTMSQWLVTNRTMISHLELSMAKLWQIAIDPAQITDDFKLGAQNPVRSSSRIAESSIFVLIQTWPAMATKPIRRSDSLCQEQRRQIREQNPSLQLFPACRTTSGAPVAPGV